MNENNISPAKQRALLKSARGEKINDDFHIKYDSIANYDNYYNLVLSDTEIGKIINQYSIDNENAYKEFLDKTKLRPKDLPFLFLATGLQILRWSLMEPLGDKIDSSERLPHDDKSIKNDVSNKNKEFQNNHSNWGHGGSKKFRSWEEIIFSSVPYDATRGAGDFNINMEGGYHRYKTLGHDPILGWIFGTANIITETITLNNFTSNRVKNMTFAEPVALPVIFKEVYESLMEDWHRLPAAVFAQGVHLASDKYTKLGLPIPILGVFSEQLAGALYKSQYDSLCLLKDAKTVAKSAIISVLINMIIGLMHGLFYNNDSDYSKELYEVRTMKIIDYSNFISMSSNIVFCLITENPKKLDIGGILVAIATIIKNDKVQKKIMREFIDNKISNKYTSELIDVKSQMNKLISEMY